MDLCENSRESPRIPSFSVSTLSSFGISCLSSVVIPVVRTSSTSRTLFPLKSIPFALSFFKLKNLLNLSPLFSLTLNASLTFIFRSSTERSVWDFVFLLLTRRFDTTGILDSAPILFDNIICCTRKGFHSLYFFCL